jgi:hypothetical protein
LIDDNVAETVGRSFRLGSLTGLLVRPHALRANDSRNIGFVMGFRQAANGYDMDASLITRKPVLGRLQRR